MYRMDCACGAGALGWRLFPSHPPKTKRCFPRLGAVGPGGVGPERSVDGLLRRSDHNIRLAR